MIKATSLLCIGLLLFGILNPLFAHEDDKKPKTPSKAVGDLKRARIAMDAYRARLQKEGHYSCCMKPPVGSKVDGCDSCARVSGSCHCGANLVAGKGVCGECFGAWKFGKGSSHFGKVEVKSLKVLASDFQKVEGTLAPDVAPEMKVYLEAMTKAKRTLIAEKRYSCCVGRSGCDECAHETYCGCGVNLAKDLASKPTEPKRGICAQCLDGQHAGQGRLGEVDLATLVVMPPDDDMRMRGALGAWSMNREASGTSWIPESSPMYARMNLSGRYRVMQMGLGFAGYTDSGGKKGERQFLAPTQYMLMGQRETGGGTLSLRGMLSLDALLMPHTGYPNLFQIGENLHGTPLFNRQHPHDLFMELGISYSKKIKDRVRGFLYLAPVGEAPLGPAAFQHRPSAWDNPLSPLTHHWLESAHISSGVLTAGLTMGSQWKLEGSLFTGRETDDDRYRLDTIHLDSRAVRLSYNPSPKWSFQTSFASVHHPDPLSADSQERFSLSGHYNQAYANGDNIAVLLGYGLTRSVGESSKGLLLEASYRQKRTTWFSRFESVEPHEAAGIPAGGIGKLSVRKWSFGGVYNFMQNRKTEQGLGAAFDLYSLSSNLTPLYGNNPFAFTLFYRLRFGRM